MWRHVETQWYISANFVGAAFAGSLVNLAKYPASTVQILGAEKALFRCAAASSWCFNLTLSISHAQGHSALNVTQRDPGEGQWRVISCQRGSCKEALLLCKGVSEGVPCVLQGVEDKGQHAQVRAHLPLLLHRPRQAAQQGPNLTLPRQQVLHRLQVSLSIHLTHFQIRFPCTQTRPSQ